MVQAKEEQASKIKAQKEVVVLQKKEEAEKQRLESMALSKRINKNSKVYMRKAQEKRFEI